MHVVTVECGKRLDPWTKISKPLDRSSTWVKGLGLTNSVQLTADCELNHAKHYLISDTDP